MKTKLGLFTLMMFPLFAQASLPRASSVPGGIAVIPIGSTTAIPDKPKTWLGDQPVLVTADHNKWYAVVGLPLSMTPGPYELNVDLAGGKVIQSFKVHSKEYPAQYITLKDNDKVQLSKINLERAEREITQIKELEHHWRAAQDTDLTFIMPVKGRLASRFGLRRFFNGKPRNPHAGLDVAVPRGTPVKASAQGEVLATGDYFFNGKTVFLDHGNGLISMYCHLDQIDVHAGEQVKKGQLIAHSGMTGRATGPHLHWSVILNGTMVNPQLFLSAKRK